MKTISRFFIFMTMMFIASPVFAAAPSAPPPKQTPPAKLLGTFGNWKAFTFTQNGAPVCYMTLTLKTSPHAKRAPAYLMITHRPGEGSKDVVSFTSGYNFKPASDATAVAGKKSFDLFTQTDTAWSRDPATDHTLATAISQSASIKFTGTPAAKNAKPIADTIDLKGAMPAYQAISKACGIPVEAPPKPAAPVKKKTAKHS